MENNAYYHVKAISPIWLSDGASAYKPIPDYDMIDIDSAVGVFESLLGLSEVLVSAEPTDKPMGRSMIIKTKQYRSVLSKGIKTKFYRYASDADMPESLFRDMIGIGAYINASDAIAVLNGGKE